MGTCVCLFCCLFVSISLRYPCRVVKFCSLQCSLDKRMTKNKQKFHGDSFGVAWERQTCEQHEVRDNTSPEEFENEGFTLQMHQFSVHTASEEFENAAIKGAQSRYFELF